MRFHFKLRNLPKWRRRILTAFLLTALLVAGFYAEERIRGAILLDRAFEAVQAEGLPVSSGSAFAPNPPEERNLFYSKTFQNRLIWTEHEPHPVVIGWGDIQPASVREGKKSRPVRTDPGEGRTIDFSAVLTAMRALGWTVPDAASPAEAVRSGLDRYENELTEWSAEIRNRPEWAVPDEFVRSRDPARRDQPDHFSDLYRFSDQFDSVIANTESIFLLRAKAGAVAGRENSKVLDDLESAALLGRHVYYGGQFLPEALWEILMLRNLNDEEFVRAASILPDAPATEALLRKSWFVSLGFGESVLSPMGSGAAGAIKEEYWDNPFNEYDSFMERVLKRLWMLIKPQGWFRQEEAHRLRVMLVNKNWLRSVSEAWNGNRRIPSRTDYLPLPWRGLLQPFAVRDSFDLHLHKCGCLVDAVISDATMSRLGKVAVGLERYRLRHGTWPENLAAAADLIPGGLRPDPWTGGALTFRHLPEGGWELSARRNIEVWKMPLAP